MQPALRRMREAEHRRMVGGNLALAREAVGKRQVDWVREYGLRSSGRLGNWEAGEHYPNPLFLVQLCEDYGFTMDYFYRGQLAGVSVARAADLRRVEAERQAESAAEADRAS